MQILKKHLFNIKNIKFSLFASTPQPPILRYTPSKPLKTHYLNHSCINQQNPINIILPPPPSFHPLPSTMTLPSLSSLPASPAVRIDATAASSHAPNPRSPSAQAHPYVRAFASTGAPSCPFAPAGLTGRDDSGDSSQDQSAHPVPTDRTEHATTFPPPECAAAPHGPPANTLPHSRPSSGLGLSDAGRGTLYYPDYLRLDALLACQQPVSFARGEACHDEMLFIIIHQTYELWFKQLLFELDSVRNIFSELNIGEKRISLALHRLTRIREIQKLLNDQIRVLETMTAQEFLEFRDYLFPASGFQSFQFRLLEIKLGVSPEQRLNSQWILNIAPRHQHLLRETQQEPSLFDYVERWLRNIPFRDFRGYSFQKSYQSAVSKMFEIERKNIVTRIPDGPERHSLLTQLASTFRTFQSVYDRDVHEEMIRTKRRRLGFRATAASLMIMLYQDEPMFQLPARLLQVLVDVDEQLNQWRYRHSQMVHRMIGVKIGTGGSLGHSYLKRTIDSQKVFADIANLSTLLIPRRLLPPLPAELSDQMKYFHSIEKFDRTLFEMGGGGDVIDWSFC